MDIRKRIREKLVFLYGEENAPDVFAKLVSLIGDRPPAPPVQTLPVSEKDVVLITYGDQVQRDGEPPLATLRQFLNEYAQPVVNSAHLLPFFPYSSDDGFSVIDYLTVNPALGDWEHVRALGQDFRLMFDAVINHISAQSDWFQAFLRGESPYPDYFIVVDPAEDLSTVVRPRALPLLTPFETPDGTKHVWTTFSADQIDLNYSNPDVLLEILRALLFYVEQGAKLIRLDAIAFLWKVIGTACIHLPQTHAVVQLLRDVLDWVAPEVILVTETNVPHLENIAYFGDGTNEAQLVYQFPLPPLILHTLTQGDAQALSEWAATLATAGKRATFFNFAASHDGIGLRPVAGILAAEEIDALVNLARARGGRVSYRNMPDGSQLPYELNISYFDAITDPAITARDPDTAVRRFIVSQAIMLALAGVPGIYFHSLFGSRNCPEGVQRTGHFRSINREKLDYAALTQALADPATLRARVYRQYHRLLAVRTQEAAFHPLGQQAIHKLGAGVLAVERMSPDGQEHILALHNVTGQPVEVAVPVKNGNRAWHDLIQDRTIRAEPDILRTALSAYQVLWLKAR